jgi:hypothetical protein
LWIKLCAISRSIDELLIVLEHRLDEIDVCLVLIPMRVSARASDWRLWGFRAEVRNQGADPATGGQKRYFVT